MDIGNKVNDLTGFVATIEIRFGLQIGGRQFRDHSYILRKHIFRFFGPSSPPKKLRKLDFTDLLDLPITSFYRCTENKQKWQIPNPQ